MGMRFETPDRKEATMKRIARIVIKGAIVIAAIAVALVIAALTIPFKIGMAARPGW